MSENLDYLNDAELRRLADIERRVATPDYRFERELARREMQTEKRSIRRRNQGIDPVSDFLTQGAEAELRYLLRVMLPGLRRD